ncbi:odorant receptor 49b-like, partial [Zootermopsis nevadensis]|uniref:odorant receptor 49b-like n=1 Tax=Zootermopsis nevadensis TaxID=136037 RepID=UPI000B8E270E
VLTTKYVAGFLTSLTQLYALSWFGQGIINQSLAVGQTAYNCAWFQRSMTFRRLILTVLIRAQKPLQVTLGKLLPLSIELFALIF